MIEEQVTVTVTRVVLDTIDDARDLQDWATSQPEMYCTISALTDGGWYIEVGGRTVDTVRPVLGDTVVWDGVRFTVTSPEPVVPVAEEPAPVPDPGPPVTGVNGNDQPVM